MANNIFSPPLAPIIRTTPSNRVTSFVRESPSIYNKFSPYPQTNRDIGPQQPYIYVKLTDSESVKNLTQYDTQAVPTNSAFRDLSRINKFLGSGKGRTYLATQALLQNENAFNETRIYNPLSVSAATAQPGTFGLTGRPRRYIQVGGGIFSFFATATLNTIGLSSLTISDRIEGTATAPLSTQIRVYGGEGTRAGLPRYQTSNDANSRFLRAWAGTPSNSNFFSSFIRSLARSIPSTNPSGFLGTNSEQWNYRIEYKKDPAGDGIYHTLQQDRRQIFSFRVGSRIYKAEDVNRYSAGKIPGNPENSFNLDDKRFWYNGTTPIDSNKSPLVDRFTKMMSNVGFYNRDAIVYSGEYTERGLPRNLREQSIETKLGDDNRGIGTIITGARSNYEKRYGNQYTRLVSGPIASYYDYENYRFTETDLTIDKKQFSKGASLFGGEIGARKDIYNAQPVISGNRRTVPEEIQNGNDQSVDVIFLYFFDLVNEKYIPFRAVEMSGLSDQNSGEWEPISYLGRADKLFIYKGFSRDVNFNFKVYANSIDELIPMWERINYLTGLVRPSKYTALSATDGVAMTSDQPAMSTESVINERGVRSIGEVPTTFRRTRQDATGRFIYPPMITFRIGDLFIDQPALLNNVSVNIPNESNWESLRKDGYEYGNNSFLRVSKRNEKSRQLPVMADISVSLKLLEKERAITNGAHYGYVTGNQWPLSL